MARYDYYEAMRNDIYAQIEELGADLAKFDTADELYEAINKQFWAEDAVTGNGQNGYPATEEELEEMVYSNRQLLVDAMFEFNGSNLALWKRALVDVRYADCTIRCYILGQVAYEVAQNLWAEYLDKFEEENGE